MIRVVHISSIDCQSNIYLSFATRAALMSPGAPNRRAGKYLSSGKRCVQAAKEVARNLGQHMLQLRFVASSYSSKFGWFGGLVFASSKSEVVVCRTRPARVNQPGTVHKRATSRDVFPVVRQRKPALPPSTISQQVAATVAGPCGAQNRATTTTTVLKGRGIHLSPQRPSTKKACWFSSRVLYQRAPPLCPRIIEWATTPTERFTAGKIFHSPPLCRLSVSLSFPLSLSLRFQLLDLGWHRRKVKLVASQKGRRELHKHYYRNDRSILGHYCYPKDNNNNNYLSTMLYPTRT